MRKFKLKNPEKNEENLVYVLVEDNETRVLVKVLGLFNNCKIEPTFCLAKDDLVEIL